MENIIDELETFKRTYHKIHPSSTKKEETAAVIEKVEQYIRELLPFIEKGNAASTQYDSTQKALFLLEAAKLYNVLEDHVDIAEKFLSKSLKMNPKSADGWHEMGKCVLKRHDLEFAQSCFRIAMGLNKTPQTLTSLAITVRLIGLKLSEPAQSEMRSKAMDLIIEARRLDSNYGPGNCAFATGLFYCFFSTAKVELTFLDKVIENYKKSLECKLTRTDPQVYINMATCLKFMEKYDEALENYQKAIDCDSRNEFETIEKMKSCSNYLLKFSDAIQKKGKVKAKRLQEMVNELKKQPISEDVFRVKIIGTVSHEETIPVALVGVDAFGDVYGMTIYNCVADFGFVIGDTVTIARPDYRKIEKIEVPRVNDTHVAIGPIKWVRVATPTQMKKNGAALPDSIVARAVAATQTK